MAEQVGNNIPHQPPPLIDEHDNDYQGNNNNCNLVCHWNHCLKVFPNHPSLASHLSEDHVGWKKGGYFCDWNNCARQGAKCHNRFALMMHLRIHTGEKPFECTVLSCGQTFGRMDALVRHKKAEHGEASLDKPTSKPILSSIHTLNNNHTLMTPPITIAPPLPLTSPSQQQQSLQTIANNKPPKSNNNKKAMTSLDMLAKNKRTKIRKVQPQVSGLSSNGEESDNESLASNHHYKQQITTTTTLLSGSTDYNQYRLAKAQLHYILRENEMLQDEFELAQKKLKRMRTERRVLLDAVMTEEKRRRKGKEKDIEDVEVEEGEVEGEDYELIPDINQHSTIM